MDLDAGPDAPTRLDEPCLSDAAWSLPPDASDRADVDGASLGSGGAGRTVRILGSRGIPAAHGGFETFAERLSLYLVARGWTVEVYCQDDSGDGPPSWRGVTLRQMQSPVKGTLGSLLFDLKAALHARHRDGVVLILGYNTALFALIHRLRRQTVVFNMDGLEWQRAKWSRPARAWLYLNERLACWLGHSLIADHPRIAEHLATRVSPRKITVLPYGADRVDGADASVLDAFGLRPGGYVLVIARPEPENSIFEVVSAFASLDCRDVKLVVLGSYRPDSNDYHAQIMQAANGAVLFPGPVYDAAKLASLRSHALAYVHGHRVGGTNPSLVEALGAGSPVLAHDNRFNRWVAGPGALYFSTVVDCARRLEEIIGDPALRARMSASSQARFAAAFDWDRVLGAYELFLTRASAQRSASPGRRRGFVSKDGLDHWRDAAPLLPGSEPADRLPLPHRGAGG